jgi:hypothetical protein
MSSEMQHFLLEVLKVVLAAKVEGNRSNVLAT